MADVPETTMPQVMSAPGGERIYVTIYGIEHGLSRLQAEWLFLALGREFHPEDMKAWFPTAGECMRLED